MPIETLNGAELRVLIVRLSAIGDAVLTLPVLNALRENYPHARIGWVAQQGPSAVLRGHQALDDLFEVPRGWLKSPRRVLALRRQLREFQANVCLDVQGLVKSAIPALLSGARRRIGFARSDMDGRELSPWLNNELVAPEHSHVVDRNLELLRPLGIYNPPVRFHVPEHAEEVAAVDDFLHQHKMTAGFIVLNVGASILSKRWPLEYFIELARYLAVERGLRSVIPWGDAVDLQRAEEMSKALGNDAVIYPRSTLTSLGSMLKQARLFVGSDTGPLHLAVAMGTRCVGLYGSTAATRSGPYGSQHVVVCRHHVQNSDSARRVKTDEPMRAISVADARQACDSILDSACDTDAA